MKRVLENALVAILVGSLITSCKIPNTARLLSDKPECSQGMTFIVYSLNDKAGKELSEVGVPLTQCWYGEKLVWTADIDIPGEKVLKAARILTKNNISWVIKVHH